MQHEDGPIRGATGEATSNAGKWDAWYKDVQRTENDAFLYGDALTYRMAASFFADVDVVEDWGCGRGGFRNFCTSRYVGVDGSRTPYADKIADLADYRTDAEGILLRHVLEHDYNWEKILANAVKSFRRKLCIVLFTDFSESTRELAHNKALGVDVPDLSFAQADIEKHLAGNHFKLVKGLVTKSQYKIEHVYFVWRPQRRLFEILDRYVPRLGDLRRG